MLERLIIPKMRALSGRANRLIAPRYGKRFPFWYVIEYPKSGGTWLAQMLSDYLGYPFPQHSLLPVTHKAVLQTHWGYTPNLTNVFYLVRDGRDVMVSFYWMRMRAVKRSRYASDLAHKKRYENLFGEHFDPDDIRGNLPKFIEQEMRHPRECHLNWANHVDEWWSLDSGSIFLIQYEELLRDCAGTLSRGLANFDVDVDLWRLKTSVRRYDFERLTGRKPGEVDNSSFLRSGVSGDWRENFSEDAVNVFDHYAGRTLERVYGEELT